MDINITNPVTTSKIGEVVNGANAATPNDTDLVPIVESSVTKKLTLTNLKAFLKTYFDTLYAALTASSFGTFINGLTSKTTPVDADELIISDSAAANVAKKVTGTNFKAYLKTYFDTIYQAAGSYLTSANITQTITNGVTTNAPSEDAVFDALALKQNIVSGVDDTEIGYLNGVTSSIQTQLNDKAIASAWWMMTSYNPADNTYVYFRAMPQGGTAVGAPIIPTNFQSCPVTCSRMRVTFLSNVTGTLGSNESGTLKIFNITQGTNATISTAIKHDTMNATTYADATLSMTAGDTYYFELLHPTYGTNPTAVLSKIDVSFIK